MDTSDDIGSVTTDDCTDAIKTLAKSGQLAGVITTAIENEFTMEHTRKSLETFAPQELANMETALLNFLEQRTISNVGKLGETARAESLIQRFKKNLGRDSMSISV